MAQTIEIKEVKNSEDLKKFIQFPRKLYKNCPYYVPALDKGEEKLLTKHPALAFCDLRMWLALRDGEIVGRIAGIINHRCNEIKGQKYRNQRTESTISTDGIGYIGEYRKNALC